MKLAYWMYSGPAHIGTLRVASSFKNVHAIMHAPLGDDYFNVMRSMLERERDFTPVTASIVDRHVLARGSQERVVENIKRKDLEEKPDLILLTPTCTSSILQEDLYNFADRSAQEALCDVILADVNHYRVNEFQAADRTLEQVVRFYLEKAKKDASLIRVKTVKPSVNIIGSFTLGFHNQHDMRELKRLLFELGIQINQVIPEGNFVTNLKKLPEAWFNIVPYREIGLMTALYLEKEYQIPYLATTPMGIIDTTLFINQIQQILLNQNWFVNFQNYIDHQTRFVSQAAWFSRSIDCQNLTGKKAVVFGDATHAASITKILAREMGIHVSCSGTYCKHDSDWFREQVQGFCDEVLITDDHTQVANMIERLDPSAIFGSQMERHVGKRLGIPCGVISAPVHIQNFSLGYRPFLGFEGTNQIADLVYNSFTLGMEDHLLEIFGGHDTKESDMRMLVSQSELESLRSGPTSMLSSPGNVNLLNPEMIHWSSDSLLELNKIPGFVRTKVKRNTEDFARKKSLTIITIEVMYAAKEDINV